MIKGIGGDDSISIDTTQLNRGSVLSSGVLVDAGAGNDSIAYTGPSSGTPDTQVVLRGNDDNDALAVTGLQDSGSLHGGDGADSIDAHAALLTNFQIAAVATPTSGTDSYAELISLPLDYLTTFTNLSITTFGSTDKVKKI